VHVESYKGLRVGVDAHCWLHRGSYGCSKELAEGIPTMKYIEFCIGMLEMLMSYGVKDIIGNASSCRDACWSVIFPIRRC
jgi:exonuclease 1